MEKPRSDEEGKNGRMWIVLMACSCSRARWIRVRSAELPFALDEIAIGDQDDVLLCETVRRDKVLFQLDNFIGLVCKVDPQDALHLREHVFCLPQPGKASTTAASCPCGRPLENSNLGLLKSGSGLYVVRHPLTHWDSFFSLSSTFSIGFMALPLQRFSEDDNLVFSYYSPLCRDS